MTKLTILGSGTAVSSSYPAGYLLQHKKNNWVIDCGEGIRHRLARQGVDYFDVDTVFLSHFHPDHFNVETLIQSMQVRNFSEKKEKHLTIYGPPETAKRIKAIWDAKHFDGNFEDTLPNFVKLTILEYENGKTYKVGDAAMTPYFLDHGNMPAAALRFEIENKILVYSGDTGMNEEIKKTCAGADIFICECNQQPGTSKGGHLNPQEVGEIAKKGSVKQVVLTHMPGIDSDETLIDEVKKSGFTGAVRVGHDLDMLQL